MKKSITKTLILSLLFAMAIGTATVHAQDVSEIGTTEEPEITIAPEPKNGLFKEDGHYYFYKDDVKVKNCWKTVGKNTFYFNSKGQAVTGVQTIKNVKYVFSSKSGYLQKATTTSTKVVTVNGTKYLVTKEGKAKRYAWDSSKTYYFGKKYVPVTGTQVINDKFYVFYKSCKVNSSKTKTLQAATKYKKNFSTALKLLGKPSKKVYRPGCFGSGKDGYLTYKNFTVYTYKEGKKEIFMGADPNPSSPTYKSY